MKNYLHLLISNMFLFTNSLTTIYSKTIISLSSGTSCKSLGSKIPVEFLLNSIFLQNFLYYSLILSSSLSQENFMWLILHTVKPLIERHPVFSKITVSDLLTWIPMQLLSLLQRSIFSCFFFIPC